MLVLQSGAPRVRQSRDGLRNIEHLRSTYSAVAMVQYTTSSGLNWLERYCLSEVVLSRMMPCAGRRRGCCLGWYVCDVKARRSPSATTHAVMRNARLPKREAAECRGWVWSGLTSLLSMDELDDHGSTFL